MQQDVIVLWQSGSFSLSVYGLMMAAGAMLAIALTVLLNRKTLGTASALSAALACCVGAVLGGHIVYCLADIRLLLADYEDPLRIFLTPPLGGYCLYGAVWGGMLGLLIYSKATKRNWVKLMDAAAPGAMLALCFGRAAEYFTNQGMGKMIDSEAMMWFPMGLPIIDPDFPDYVEWRVPVFMYEALIGLALMVLAIWLLQKRKNGSWSVSGTILTLLGVTQIFMEQLRGDDYIRYGFVRFAQLAAIVTVTAVFVVRTVLKAKKNGFGKRDVLRIALLVLSVLIVIFVEFALEKPKFMPFLQISMYASAILYAVFMLKEIGKSKGILCTVVLGVAAVVACSVLLMMGLELESENAVLMLIMALGLSVTTLVTEH